jgi:HlyD family secretion protein
MEQAERDFQRTRINFEGKIASESDFEKARSTLDGARAAYEAARNRVEQNRAGLTANRDTLSKTTVLSPIDGIVTTLPVKAGEVTVIGTMNNAGTQLMTISDMSIVQAVLMVDETDTPAVQVGQKALLTRLPPEPGGTKCGPSAYAEELLALGAQRGRSISQMLPVVSAYS